MKLTLMEAAMEIYKTTERRHFSCLVLQQIGQ
jgi:hypothetical protein